MKTPELINDREKRTEIRKTAKFIYDEQISLKAGSKGTKHRLLDEGMVVDSAGNPWFYLAKGTLSKFLRGENEHLQNISDDYIGHIDLGHIDFASFPLILGTWTKSDMELVDIEDGRNAIDIDISLDEESALVKELKRMPYAVGISAEFSAHYNESLTDEVSNTLHEYVPVYDEICITGFGVVGDCGNVNSGDLELKENETMEDIKNLSVEIEETELSQDEEAEAVTASVEEAEIENADDTIEAEVEKGEEDDAEGAESEEAGEEFEELSSQIDALIKENSELKEKLQVYEDKLKRQGKKLKAQAEKVEGFSKRFPKLSVSMGLSKEEPEEEKEPVLYSTGDGIGE